METYGLIKQAKLREEDQIKSVKIPHIDELNMSQEEWNVS